MECRECGKPVDDNKLGVSVWGQFCSDSCRESFHRERLQRHAKLSAEPLFQTPAQLTVPDFEEFALKVAVYANNLDSVQDVPEGMREPDILAMQVKEILLHHLPGEYVRAWVEGSGWTRQNRYSFRKPVPQEVLRAAMQDAGFEWKLAWFGNAKDHAFAATELGTLFRSVREELLRAADAAERGIEPTAGNPGASDALQSLMNHMRRLDERWTSHYRVAAEAAEAISIAAQLSPKQALKVLDRLEGPLRILALDPAMTAS